MTYSHRHRHCQIEKVKKTKKIFSQNVRSLIGPTRSQLIKVRNTVSVCACACVSNSHIQQCISCHRDGGPVSAG